MRSCRKCDVAPLLGCVEVDYVVDGIARFQMADSFRSLAFWPGSVGFDNKLFAEEIPEFDGMAYGMIKSLKKPCKDTTAQI